MHNQNLRGQNSDPQNKNTIAQKIKASIERVSINGNFQRRMIILFMLVALIANMQASGSKIFYMNPVFSCENIASKVHEDQACEMMNFCSIINKGSVTAQLGIYCGEKKGQRTLIQSATGLGNFFGILFSGAISDRKGRKFCFCIGMVLYNMTCLFQFIGIKVQNIQLLILSEFIAGFSNKIVYLNFLVLLTRFLSIKKYEMGTIGWFLVGIGIGMIFVAGINENFDDWRIIFYVSVIGYLVFTVASFLVLWEDPIFLFDIGNLNESKRVIESIGMENEVDYESNRRNVKIIDNIFQEKMSQVENNTAQSSTFDLRELLTCEIITKILIIGVVGFLYNLAAASIDMSIQNLNYSYNFNLFVIGLSNICGFFTSYYIIRLEPKRRRGFLLTSLMYGILAFLFIFPFCYQNGAVESVIVFFLRFFICWINIFYTRLKVDSFPKKYQLTVIGIIECLSNFGHILGPYFVQLSLDKKMNPIFAINLFRMTIGTIPLFFLNEEDIKLEDYESMMKEKQKMICEIES